MGSPSIMIDDSENATVCSDLNFKFHMLLKDAVSLSAIDFKIQKYNALGEDTYSRNLVHNTMYS